MNTPQGLGSHVVYHILLSRALFIYIQNWVGHYIYVHPRITHVQYYDLIPLVCSVINVVSCSLNIDIVELSSILH